MSAWDEAAVRTQLAQALDAAWRATCIYKPDPDPAATIPTWFAQVDTVIAALAPHLAARDAAVRRAALEEAATLADKYHDLPEWAHGTALDVGEAIRALATDATP